MQVIKSITLDVSQNYLLSPIFAKQVDDGTRFLKIQLTDNGVPIQPESGSIARFRGVKPDRHSFDNIATINSDHTITVELTEQVLACAGLVKCDVAVVKNGDTIASANLALDVQEIPLNGNQVISSNEFTYLVGVTEEVENMTVSAHALETGSTPTVTKTGGGGEPLNLDFGLQKGDKGDTGETGPQGPQGPQGEPGSDASVTAQNIQSALGYTPYNKLSTGIPKTDLASAVQNSLEHADSAIQTETDPNVPSWAKQSAKPTYTKSEIGLGNVDNTSDLNKPVSTATQTALNAKANSTDVESALALKANTTDVESALSLKADEDDLEALAEDVTAIESKIPTQATAQNQLADKAFVNSTVGTNTAIFRGTFNSLAELQAYSGEKTNNDYAFVKIYDETVTTVVKAYDRYKYNGSTWVFEYELNNSSFTANQWAAINSEITSAKVGSYDGHVANGTIHVTDADKTSWSGKYAKPSGGIPKTDLASAVQASLSLADSALQQHQSLSAYRTASDQDTIDSGKQDKITASGLLKGNGSGGVSAAVAGTDYQDPILFKKTPALNIYRIDGSDIAAIYDGNDNEITTTYATKKETNAKYTKPTTGIPKTDLASAVQTSLGLADSALQYVPSTYRTASAQDTIDNGKENKGKITISGIEKTANTHTVTIVTNGVTTNLTLVGVS